MSKPKVFIVKGIRNHPILYTLDDDDELQQLTEKRLGQFIHHFSELTIQAKERHLADWLDKDANVALDLEVNPYLTNSPWKVDGHRPTRADGERGAQALLAVTELFGSPVAGYRLLADTLCGLHATALREAEPTFQPAISVRSDSPEIERILRTWVRAVVPRKKWRRKRRRWRWRVKRTAILDYRRQGIFSPHLRDYARLTVKLKKKHSKIKQLFLYRDTVMLVIGGEMGHLHELVPWAKDAAIFLLNSSGAGLDPTVLSTSDISSYDPQILETIRAESSRIASLLRYWWGYWDDSDAWAAQIVQEARASFGTPDSRYISVQPEPKALRDAIRYRVFLGFLDMLETEGLMTSDELMPYCQGATEVFYPAPPEPTVVRHVEEPEIFIELMREIIAGQRDNIVSESERFIQKGKNLAARRTINGSEYFVFPEEGWAKVFSKAAHSHKDVDCSFFQRERWVQGYQKVLCESEYELIKHTGSAHRYRYDLYETGKRDATYVLAIPVELIEK